jgi:GAF domain-containing protein
VDADGVEERLAAGLHVLLRHAPGFHDLPATLPSILERRLPLDGFGLCPDIAWADSLFEGCFDETVREAIRLGVDPIAAIRMATVMPARYFRVDHDVGVVAPGRFADLVLLSDLERFRIHTVLADGRPVVEDGEVVLRLEQPLRPAWTLATMNVPRPPDASQLAIPGPVTEGEARVRVIDVEDGRYLSEETQALLPVRGGVVQALPERGIAKVALLERLDGSGAVGVGFVRGFGLRRGGIGSASNPLTQAVVGVAADDRELAATLAAVVSAQGAFVAVENEAVVASLPTPVFGQTSDLGYDAARSAARDLVAAWRQLGCELETPFAQLEFVAATSEPYLRISTRGLVRADPGSAQRIAPVPVVLGCGDDPVAELERVADRLCRELAASRVTIRLGPTRNLPILAEALDIGVPSLRRESSIDQLAAETVRWVVEHRRVLAVDEAATGIPRTPRAMVEQYGLRSFLIAPVEVDGVFAGSVSVHVNDVARSWTGDDEVVAASAARDVACIAAGEPALWMDDL